MDDKQADLMVKFTLKWTQGEDTGFIKPTCHIEDIEKLVRKVLELERKKK